MLVSLLRKIAQEEDEFMEENIKMLVNMDDELDGIGKIKSSVFSKMCTWIR